MQVLTWCPDCGDIELDASAVRLVCVRGTETREVAFTCPACADRVREPISTAAHRRLQAAGARSTVVSPDHPAAGHAVVRQFQRVLASEDRLVALL